MTVMQSLGCHTVKTEIQPNDQGWSCGQPCQRAQINKGPGWGDLGMREGQTRWYGFAFRTNPGYAPHYGEYSGDWNIVQAFHNMPINGVWGPKAPIQMAVSTEGPTGGANCWPANTALSRLPQPRLDVQLAGGDQSDPDWWLKDGVSATNRHCLGPAFSPGHLYRVQYKVTWGAHQDGAIEWWVDGVKYVDLTRISNLWYSGSTVDTGTYPLFGNYRPYDTSLPTSDVYHAGFVVGSTQADVNIP